MTLRIFTLALTLALTAQTAGAACYADYKAKQDGGALKLHYGVAELPEAACGDPGAAERALAPRLKAGGWTLLTILSTFGPEGLDSRRTNAGPFFLRF